MATDTLPTTTQDTPPASVGAGSNGELLGSIRAAKAAEEQSAREVWIGIAAWCDRHTTGALMPEVHGTYGLLDLEAVTCWQDRYGMPGADEFLDLAGAGAPAVSDFAVTELVTLLGRTLMSGRLLVGDVLETRHRLPKVWARLVAGEVTAWRAGKIARETRTLTPEAAGFVDGHIAHIAHCVGLPTITRLVAEAAARFDPETTELEECDTRASLHVHLDLAEAALSIGSASAVLVEALIDRADAEELEAALQTLAHQLLLDGSTDDLQVRRAKALGMLARGEWSLAATGDPVPSDRAADPEPGGRGASAELGGGGADAEPGGRAASPAPDGRAASERRRDRASHKTTATRRQVVLHVHLTDAALTGTPAVDQQTGKLGLHLARLENHRQLVTADTVRDWLSVSGTSVTVKPIIDLNDTVAVDSYEIPDRIAHRVRLTRTKCAFPYCQRPARSEAGNGDLDHITEYVPPDRGGPPGQTSTRNLVPECRHDHRIKTHPSALPTLVLDRARWRVQQLTSGTYLWASPYGQRYLVHPDGTTQI